MAISTNPKPTIYRNLYVKMGPWCPPPNRGMRGLSAQKSTYLFKLQATRTQYVAKSGI